MSEEKKPFTFGEPRPLTGAATCGAIIAESVCGEPGTHHLIFDGGNTMSVVCVDHYRVIMAADKRVPPEDEHMIGKNCTMPGTRWLYSTPDQTGYCFVPGVDVEMMDAAVTVEDLEPAS